MVSNFQFFTQAKKRLYLSANKYISSDVWCVVSQSNFACSIAEYF